MPYSYPSSSDVSTFLTSIGVSVGSYDCAGALASAIAEWEFRTGWEPFARDSADRTEFFDPPDYGSFGIRLFLRRGLLSLTSLTIGCELNGTGGDALTSGVDYVLLPYYGGVDGKPYTSIEFVNQPLGRQRSVKIIGKFGYTNSANAEVSGVIIQRAAQSCLEDLAGASGSLKKIEQGPVTLEYDTTAGRATVDRWEKNFYAAVRRYRGPWL